MTVIAHWEGSELGGDRWVALAGTNARLSQHFNRIGEFLQMFLSIEVFATGRRQSQKPKIHRLTESGIFNRILNHIAV
jgi:hypothetical protein